MRAQTCRVAHTTLSLTLLFGCTRHAAPEAGPAPAPGLAPVATPAATPSTSDNSRSLVRQFRGSYTYGFELSWFEPCDTEMGDRLWWVTLTDQALAQRDSLLATIRRRPTDGLAVRWSGTISPRMMAGQMGRGSRYLLVTAISDIYPLPAGGACAPRATGG